MSFTLRWTLLRRPSWISCLAFDNSLINYHARPHSTIISVEYTVHRKRDESTRITNWDLRRPMWNISNTCQQRLSEKDVSYYITKFHGKGHCVFRVSDLVALTFRENRKMVNSKSHQSLRAVNIIITRRKRLVIAKTPSINCLYSVEEIMTYQTYMIKGII